MKPKYNLMPFQYNPFNGDNFVCEIFLNLAKKHDCNIAFETGTCLGGTTKFLADNFKKVFTIEINKEYQNEAKLFVCKSNVDYYLGASEQISENIIKEISKNENVIFFLDSHWGNYCPLLKELELIGKHRQGKDVIVIHDFRVPRINELGYDSYNGKDFDIDFVKNSFKTIFGLNNYSYFYNREIAGAKRGVLFVERKLI